jgi:diguanylate cyclase (GGDEF)-like protein
MLLALNVWSMYLPETAALAAVALIGYLFGTRTRDLQRSQGDQVRRELRRAKLVAKQLEAIADSVRKDLAAHRACVSRFKDRVSAISTSQTETSWKEMCSEAEDMLKPTLRLAMQISHAYDEIRQQSNQLMTFTEVRTDPLTGVSNRRALDDTLENMFSMMQRYQRPFTLGIFDIDHFKQINDQQGHLYGDRMLQKFARLLDDCVRDTDVVARYGGEEFVVIMPHTPLDGACVFSDRMRQIVDAKLPLTVSGGLAEAGDGDTPHSLLGRADSALYSAKAAGRNCVYRHDGKFTEPVVDDPVAPLDSDAEAKNEVECAAV